MNYWPYGLPYDTASWKDIIMPSSNEMSKKEIMEPTIETQMYYVSPVTPN